MSFGFTPSTSPSPTPPEPADSLATGVPLPAVSEFLADTPAPPILEEPITPVVDRSEPGAVQPIALPLATEFQDIVAPKPQPKPNRLGLVLVVALVAIAATGLAIYRERQSQPTQPKSASSQPTSEQAPKPSFVYLAPHTDSAWDYQAASLRYDDKAGVARYSVTFTDSSAVVQVTEQPMPTALKPRTSTSFKQLIEDTKATKSTTLAQGTAYLVPAFGSSDTKPTSATAIYATEDLLLFARADRVVPDDVWIRFFKGLAMTAPLP